MTMEEKRDLSIALSEMGPEMLTGIVDIIKQRHADLMTNDEELELDIDALDAGTLRALKQYVDEKAGEAGHSQPQVRAGSGANHGAHLEREEATRRENYKAGAKECLRLPGKQSCFHPNAAVD